MNCMILKEFSRGLKERMVKFNKKCFTIANQRRNFSLVARYSLKFTRCPLLVVKSLVTRCKIFLLLIAEVTRCKKSLVTRCKIRSSLVVEAARWKDHSLVVAEVSRCKKLFVTRENNNKSIKLGESFSFFNIQ